MTANPALELSIQLASARSRQIIDQACSGRALSVHNLPRGEGFAPLSAVLHRQGLIMIDPGTLIGHTSRSLTGQWKRHQPGSDHPDSALLDPVRAARDSARACRDGLGAGRGFLRRGCNWKQAPSEVLVVIPRGASQHCSGLAPRELVEEHKLLERLQRLLDPPRLKLGQNTQPQWNASAREVEEAAARLAEFSSGVS